MNVYFFQDTPGFYFETETKTFYVIDTIWRQSSRKQAIVNLDVLRFLKTKYTNRERYIAGFTNPISQLIQQCSNPELLKSLSDVLVEFKECYDIVKPYSYTEAFKLTSEIFKSIVFGCIRVPEMIRELGHTRIATAGRPVKHKQFSKSGEFLGYREYDVIFETHRVNGSKLGLLESIYAVRCWCTSTDNEHWLWIDDQFKNDPLEAIARTFFIHENLIPHIKELKRQGDILLVELNSDIDPRGEMISLSKEQYFSLLTAQS
jgi:hypothetical protein